MKKIYAIITLLAVLSAVTLSSCGSASSNGTAAPENTVSEVISEAQADEIAGEDYTFEGVTVTLPEGYTTEVKSGIAYVYNPNYPTDGDNLTFTKSNESKDDYSEDALNDLFKGLFDDFEGVKNFTETEIDGYPAFKYEYDASYQGTPLHQRQIAIFKDNAVFITFTGTTEDYAADFKSIENSVRVD